MKTHARKILLAILLLALAGLCFWLYSSLEFVEEKIEVGYHGEARQNPVLAAGRLYERYGARVKFVSLLREAPPPGATLFFASSRFWLTPEKNEMLLHWVREEGGHLIGIPESGSAFNKKQKCCKNEDESASDDPLLSFLDFSTSYRSRNGKDGKDGDEGEDDEEDDDEAVIPDPVGISKDTKPGASQRCPAPENTRIALPGGELLHLGYPIRQRLFDNGHDTQWRLRIVEDSDSENSGNFALDYTVGKGSITVLSSLYFLRNPSIGESDHAALLSWLAAPVAGKEIWFVYGDDDVPSLWKWLTERVWTVLAASAALFVLWLWMASRRFGPLLPAPQTSRRSIVEHVAASARYLWRHDDGRQLYLNLLDDFMRHLVWRRPQWARLQNRELAREIVEFIRRQETPLGGLNEEAVAASLDPARTRDAQKFTEDARLLEILKKHL
ncbi:MAG: DUF4350 domain-containing protein [Betaproteobacteria bacterium]|nr:DUF4350 domain-containing protein [Betaproteobacteria bacterium]